MSLKFREMSDLHIDFAKFTIPPHDDDSETVLLLAGDICEGKGARNFIERAMKQFRYVVYCLGNHEFFNREYYALIADWQEAAEDMDNFFFLHDSVCYIDDVRIMGGCMWSSHNNRDWFAIDYAKNAMNDYRKIRVVNDRSIDSRKIYKRISRKGKALSPNDTVDFHETTVKFLDEELAKPWEGKTIVMTHHLPSHIGLHPYYAQHSNTNYAYYSPLEWLMEKHKIDVWVHGHSHYSTAYKVHDTDVYSNTRGYIPYEKEDKTKFNPHFTFTL